MLEHGLATLSLDVRLGETARQAEDRWQAEVRNRAGEALSAPQILGGRVTGTIAVRRMPEGFNPGDPWPSALPGTPV